MRSAVVYRPLCKSVHWLHCEYLIHLHLHVCYSNTILGEKTVDNIQSLQVSVPKYIRKTRKAELVLVCWSLSQNHFTSPL